MHAGHALDAHRFLLRAGLAAVHIFAWLFVFELSFLQSGDVNSACIHVLFLYSLTQIVTILVTPYSAQALSRGTRRLTIAATLVLATALVVLSATLSELNLVSGSTGAVLFAILFGLYRGIYWVPYSVERARWPSAKKIPAEFFIAFMPALCGITLANDAMGPINLLISGSIIALAALAPLRYVDETYERFSWSYKETFGELLEPKYRTLVLTSFLEGFEASTLFILWPLFVYLFIAHSYIIFGFIMTASLVLAVPVHSYTRRILEQNAYLAAPLILGAWILRLVVASPFGVIAVDTIALAGKGTGTLDAYTKEQCADNATFVDELTALKEIAGALGRLTMAFFAALLIGLVALPVGIAISCVVAGFCALYARRLVVRSHA